MRVQVCLGLALMALTYLGLAEGSPSSTWAGRSEVPSAVAHTLIGGAKCASFNVTDCKGKKCPGISGCVEAGNMFSCNLKGSKLYCGGTKSCSSVQYDSTFIPCATSSTGVLAGEAQ